MECKVKKEIEITLNLSQEEFNTIVCAYGACSTSDMESVARHNGFKILVEDKSDEFYSEIKKIAKSI